MFHLSLRHESLWNQTQQQPVTFFKDFPNGIAFGGERAAFAMVFRLANSIKTTTTAHKNSENGHSDSVWSEVQLGLDAYGILQIPLSRRTSYKRLQNLIQKHIEDVKSSKPIQPASREEIIQLFGLTS
ncbi:MAG: hypothetical protein ACFFBD_01545 [Candidatus Hodarchaeota archaeon]